MSFLDSFFEFDPHSYINGNLKGDGPGYIIMQHTDVQRNVQIKEKTSVAIGNGVRLTEDNNFHFTEIGKLELRNMIIDGNVRIIKNTDVIFEEITVMGNARCKENVTILGAGNIYNGSMMGVHNSLEI